MFSADVETAAMPQAAHQESLHRASGATNRFIEELAFNELLIGVQMTVLLMPPGEGSIPSAA